MEPVGPPDSFLKLVKTSLALFRPDNSTTTKSVMDKRIGIIGIIFKDRLQSAAAVNQILSDHGELIQGRLGLPYRERGINVISLVIDATTDEVGAFTGRLGMIPGVKVKSMLV